MQAAKSTIVSIVFTEDEAKQVLMAMDGIDGCIRDSMDPRGSKGITNEDYLDIIADKLHELSEFRNTLAGISQINPNI